MHPNGRCTYDSIMLRPAAGTKKWRIAINIGGTSSVTFLPPWPTPGTLHRLPDCYMIVT